ncbi:EPIDERMAL PATTERNING FACTOR-like protein 1 [Striga hermonthica]|uniref:Epidermal patterning factor-like protein n=1 Tax=Striga hermonthica TaxID=68872 RepID=A0A9N7RP28_STRHE|nr:EPIDERMAL PATTERNING FACTOR-like protein 1 [Striga hermonthica]
MNIPESAVRLQIAQVKRYFGPCKARLGSTPPSCHNKCNQCHPCMAVQVPTMPGHERVEPGREKLADYFDAPPAPPSSAGNRYSNYKPLGWKCRCGGHFYNP